MSSPSVTRRGDLDQRVALQVEAGHLAVDPHQTVVHPASLFASAPAPWVTTRARPGQAAQRDRRRLRDRGRGAGAGHRRRRRAGRPDRAGAHPVRDAQPARPRRRRHRHRQDEDAAGASPSSCRTPGCRCCWPTSRATCPGWRGRARPNAEDRVAGAGHRRRLDADGVPGRVPLARRRAARRCRSGRRSPSSARSC